jgi:tetratricopeptide (TPR) repeat protein
VELNYSSERIKHKQLKNLHFLFLVALFLHSCEQTEKKTNKQYAHAVHEYAEKTKSPVFLDASTKAMAEELRAIAQDPTNEDMWYLNAKKAKKYEAQRPQLQNQPGPWIITTFQAAFQWLNAGNYDRSISLMNSLFEYLKKNNIDLPAPQFSTLKEIHAIAYMRKGEIENCLENHNAYSCLLPISGPGQHENRSGSTDAISIYEELLKNDPNNLQNKWLYNIAQMTLGNYPDKVAADKRIDPKVFKSEATLEKFMDVAMDLGVAVNDISGSVILEDFNNDHYLDIMVSSYGLEDQLKYFENDKKGGFSDKTNEAGLLGLWSGLNMVQADYNNDGLIDVLVLRGGWMGGEGLHPNSLLKNEGNGKFRDVTKEVGVYSKYPTQTASWGDYNNDGHIDLFIANESTRSVTAFCELFHNNGDGTFTEKAAALGLNKQGFYKGCSWGDVNQDGWPDLYLSNIVGSNVLMLNDGKGTSFTDIAGQSNTTEPNNSFPCWFFDYNQDGLEDIFVSGFDVQQFESAAGEVAKDYLGIKTQAEKPRLYRNNGNNTFTDVSAVAKVDKVLYTMGCNVGDLNNDGYPDFYAATGTPDFRALIPNRMFLNDGGKEFKDVTTAGGFGHLQKGHGVAFGDLDSDGDQDVYAVLGGSYQGDNFMNALFQNPGTDGHFLTLKLEGTTANKAAIGALVKTVVETGKGEKAFYQRVRSGGSFGANTLRIEQGVGAATAIKQVEVFWPGNSEAEVFQGFDIDGFYMLKEGGGQAIKVDVKAVSFKKGG